MDLENLANNIFNEDIKPPKSITVSFENLESMKGGSNEPFNNQF